MATRDLGATGLRVSPVCVGCWEDRRVGKDKRRLAPQLIQAATPRARCGSVRVHNLKAHGAL